MRVVMSILMLCTAFFVLHAFAADAPTVAPAAAPAAATVSAAPAAKGWVEQHGGLQAAAVLILLCLNIALSALRDIVAKLEGVKPGEAGDAKLTVLNRLCMVVGKILDYIMGNPAH